MNISLMIALHNSLKLIMMKIFLNILPKGHKKKRKNSINRIILIRTADLNHRILNKAINLQLKRLLQYFLQEATFLRE